MLELIELYIASLVLTLATIATGCLSVLCITITKSKLRRFWNDKQV